MSVPFTKASPQPALIAPCTPPPRPFLPPAIIRSITSARPVPRTRESLCAPAAVAAPATMPAAVTPKLKDEILEELDAPYPLQQGDVDFYQDNGYVRLQNVFSADLLITFGELVTASVRAANVQSLEDDDDYAKAFTQVMNLWEHDQTVRSFVFSKRLAGIASQLLQVKGVRIYHDQALYKEPGGGCTPWHADGYYFPLSSDKILTAWVPLQPVPKIMGPLEFAAKSQKDDIGRNLSISGDSERKIQESVIQAGYHVASSSFELGEVSFHSGWTFHRADGNSTEHPRKVMTAIYMDKDMRMIEPQHANHRADHERWLPGVQPGELAASHRNPIVFSS